MTTTPTPGNNRQAAAHGPQGRPWDKMGPQDFGRPVRPVQASLFPFMDAPAADGCGTLDLFAGIDTADDAPVPEPCDSCDGDDSTACGCCPACDTLKGERCLTCGSCRCDEHDYCGPTVPAVVRAAALLLAPDHAPAVRNTYGACSRAGYAVNPGPDGQARIHHRFPNLNLFHPDRLSQEQRWAVARRQAEAYAATFEAAGWTVVRKTVTTGAILLATPPTDACSRCGHRTCTGRGRCGAIASGTPHPRTEHLPCTCTGDTTTPERHTP
ncbi:MAG: hypothetical protein HOY79_33775 [Streptomyces sp.]|nr:hypothetical protein [Streptomyces sp.]NUS11338.1 hypothetical protein [Streptomyces sp.]NUS23387.1 hypothetical protein [Streptomyces sp.]